MTNRPRLSPLLIGCLIGLGFLLAGIVTGELLRHLAVLRQLCP